MTAEPALNVNIQSGHLRLLTTREVAELVGVSSETVLRWTRRGELTAIRLPSGALRFRSEAIDGWLDERATPGREVSSNPTSAARSVRYMSSSNPEDEE
jgi:excisionase family DNA binding protein